MCIIDEIKKAENLIELYTPNQLDEWLLSIGEDFRLIKNNKKIEYYNIPCAFDTETSSFYVNNEKQTLTYEWTIGINFKVLYGRTWNEFLNVYKGIVEHFQTNVNRRLVVYIHNFSFEFQSIKKLFEWEKIFALKERKPVSALTVDGIEFRCSYLLSGYSLEKLSEQLTKYKVKKLKGNLDYNLIRHTKTPLTEKELKYCVNDVLVVMAYIQEKIENDGNITKIQLTKTGYVRKHCRDNCFYDNKSHTSVTRKYHKYRNLMKKLTLEPLEYEMLKEAFMGGFTHANPYYSRGVFHNVGSFDETSAYPAVVLSEQFPMSKGEFIKINSKEEFNECIENYCCLFEVAFTNIKCIKHFENYIPASKCRKLKGGIENNGRIKNAEYLEITITEQDFFIINNFYDWEDIKIGRFIRYQKGYLPTDFVKSVAQLYVEKTELKGVEGKEVEYLQSKERVNACYGMMVTDICRDEILFNDNNEWEKEKKEIEKAIEIYNKSKKRFLSYAWGIWVTAYARFNLFSAINEFGDDYIYSDTDSVKGQNVSNHLGYIERYNKLITLKLEKAFEFHKLDKSMLRPKTVDGVEKPIGIWDFEGYYTRFKTLGAKRYMTEKLDKKGNLDISLTVAGLSKYTSIPYLKEKYKDRIFEEFDDGLKIPAQHTGKLTHTYIDHEMQGEVTDYLGVKCRYYESSGTHLEPCEFELSLSAKYVEFLLGVVEENIYG